MALSSNSKAASREGGCIARPLGVVTRIDLIACIAAALVFEEPDLESGQIVSFATCSYQTWNSRTIVYVQCDVSRDPRPFLS